jgi:hypothetical protein
MSLEIAPQLEREVIEYTSRNGITIDELLSRAIHSERPKPSKAPKETTGHADNRAHVQALLTQWQQEEGLPNLADGQASLSLAELSAQWQKEFETLTPEEQEAERQFEEDYEKGLLYHPVAI